MYGGKTVFIMRTQYFRFSRIKLGDRSAHFYGITETTLTVFDIARISPIRLRKHLVNTTDNTSTMTPSKTVPSWLVDGRARKV